MKRFTEVPLRRWCAELCRTRSLIKDDRTPTGRGLLSALVADKLDLFSAERRLEKEKCSFYCVLYNKSMYVMGLKDSNPSRQLSPTVHLPFYFNFRPLGLSLLHMCFRGVLNYAMLLGKMEIISRVEPFDHVITFLEVIGLNGFG